jgi:Dolichyl-phosphate-mannose-protein mannosyltransferase
MTKKNSTLERHAIPSRQRTVVPAICARWFADESGIIWSLPASLVIQAILFAAVAYWRLIDTDEGLYLLASKLVAHGKRPYFDFFYQQMPALPYVYAVWSKVAGLSWISGRMLSALFSVALGGLLYRHIERLYSRKTFACLGVLLYALNNLVIGWHPVVKTYALSNLFLFCAYIFLFHEDSQHKQYWPVKAFSSGALVAFAAETRLYLIVVAPVLMASLYWSGSRLHARFKSLGYLYADSRSGCCQRFGFCRAPRTPSPSTILATISSGVIQDSALRFIRRWRPFLPLRTCRPPTTVLAPSSQY